jgi:hypothetical protein
VTSVTPIVIRSLSSTFFLLSRRSFHHLAAKLHSVRHSRPVLRRQLGLQILSRASFVCPALFLCLCGCSYLSSQSLAVLSCSSVSFTGAGSDSCTVTLSAAAPAGGVVVQLASSDTAVKVPASVTVPAGASSTTFTATVAAAWSSQTATLTAILGSTSKTFALTLNLAPYLLSVSWSAVSFGDAALDSTVTRSTTLKSMGTGTVTVTSAKVAGAGFSLEGGSFPITLAPGVAVPLWLQFDPAQAGAATGTLTLSSSAFTGGTKVVSLTGTGLVSTYQVELSWIAPEDPPETIVGYHVYRATSGSSSYELLDSSIDTGTTYTDTTVTAGVAYDYYVESVDTAGNSSAPSSVFAISIP